MTLGANALSATEVLKELNGGRLSVEALAAACLARIAQREPAVRAWSSLDADRVRAEARAMDRTGPRGPLWGLPIGVKDVILTADHPTRYNSPLYDGFHPVIDAACVSLLRAAGALVFGKTETVEFASTGRPAPTANPHDLRRTPGGSSSGSAAAVADCHVPITLGTQTGGSMIRPASFCGVFALKTTWGLASSEGLKAFAPTLDTLGWFARSAADLGLLLDVFDAAPSVAADPAAPVDLARSRIAMCRSPAWVEADASTRNALDRCRAVLEAAGATVQELMLPAAFDRAAEWQRVIMLCEGRASFLAQYRADPRKLHPNLRAQVENQAGFSRDQQIEAYDGAAACRRLFDTLAASYDAVVTPSTVGIAPLGLQATGSFAFNAMWSLLHTPCINLPFFTGESGMPLGLTLTGPRFAERHLLSIAGAMERLPAFARRRAG